MIGRAIELGLAALVTMAPFGCSDGGDPGDDPGDLVGTWRYANGFGYEESWSFTADRDFRYDRAEEDGDATSLEGTYALDGDTLDFEGRYAEPPDVSLVSEMTFHAAGDRASVPAYVPVGDHDGWVGSWTMRYHNRFTYDDDRPDVIADGGEETLELRDDGSASWRLTFDDDTPPELLEGTWREVGGAVELVQVEDGLEFPWAFPTLGDAALAQFPLDRVE